MNENIKMRGRIVVETIKSCTIICLKATGSLIGIAVLCYGIAVLLSPDLKTVQEPDIVRIEGGEQLGKWMLAENKEVANWLGQTYQGKKLQEPINIIIIDEVAKSSTEAVTYLQDSCEKAEYLSRDGHSSDYMGDIGGRLYSQIPAEKNHAFSTAPYILPNNHGRFFGPHRYNSKYYFIGAFSREGINIFSKIKHTYISFEAAKEDFVARMNERTDYKVLGKYDMRNAIRNHEAFTTGDHNGTGIVLVRRRK